MESTQQLVDTEDVYKHHPLDHTKASIRLLEILPNRSEDGFIQCHIHNTTVEASYVCLSYVWGPPSTAHRILVDGKTFHVRQNLYEFLTMAQKKPEYVCKRLWIDALCINQEDIAERNHQVQHMGPIYAKATDVHLWLGNYDFLESLINFFREWFENHPICYYGDYHTLVDRNRDSAIKSLIYNEYWSRAWVTQEILLAQHVTVLVGAEELPLPALLKAQEVFTYRNSGFSVEVDRCPFDQFRSRPEKPHAKRSLVSLILKYSDQVCAVPRDRIFSLLSLCDEGVDIDVDYEAPDQDLMYDILSKCMHSICICSASVIARCLLLDAANHESGCPYIEFEVSALPDLEDGCWNVIRSDHPRGKRVRTYESCKTIFDCSRTCSGTVRYPSTFNLLWEVSSMDGEETPVFTRYLEKGKSKLYPICRYGEGLQMEPITETKAFPVLSGIDHPRYTVRMAFWVLARAVKHRPTGLCSHCQKSRPRPQAVGLDPIIKLGYWD